MGTWGIGNFDNDTSRDVLEGIVRPVARMMTVPPQDDCDVEIVMAAVEVRKVLVEHCYASCPTRQELEWLKASVLSVYDAEIDKLEPEPDYKTGRRRVIVETFDDFIALGERQLNNDL